MRERKEFKGKGIPSFSLFYLFIHIIDILYRLSYTDLNICSSIAFKDLAFFLSILRSPLERKWQCILCVYNFASDHFLCHVQSRALLSVHPSTTQ